MEKKEKKKKSESKAKGGIHKNGGRKERDGGRGGGGEEQKSEQRQPASTNQGMLQLIIPHSLICIRRVFLDSNWRMTDCVACTSVSTLMFQKSSLPSPSTLAKSAGWIGDHWTSYTYSLLFSNEQSGWPVLLCGNERGLRKEEIEKRKLRRG